MVIKLILLVLATEALVELWKRAAPLQGIRAFITRHTPFLYSQSQQTHLLDCPYCLSVWCAFLVLGLNYVGHDVTDFILIGLALHRGANHAHLIFSLVRDRQMDLRVNRGRQ